jgi:Tfp pilus assembly PilM family ATPase
VHEIGRFVRILARQGFTPAPVVIGLPDEHVTVAELSLPAVASGAPLSDIVAAQLGRICQADPSTIECGWWATDASTAGTAVAASRRSLAAAVPLSFADPIADAFDQAGLEIEAMEVRPIALARACKPIIQPTLEILIDRSAALPVMIVLERGEVSYVRPFTPSMPRSGIERTSQGLSVEAFLAELRLTLGYLSHRHPSESITRVLLAGSDRDLTAIAETLTYTWDLQAEILAVESFAELAPACTARGPGLTVALGLALRGREP